jgi:prephenate dehydratase
MELKSREGSIAVLGPRGTFSQQAAMVYDDKLDPVFFDSIDEVIGAVSDGSVGVGIVPMENSIYGTVVKTIDGIYEKKLKVVKEVVVPIRHVVAGLSGFSKGDVAKVYSHPQALNQCRDYLDKNFSSVERVKTLSTSC